MIEFKVDGNWYSIRQNIVFDDLPEDKKESLKVLGFKSGDNLTKMFENHIKKTDYYEWREVDV